MTPELEKGFDRLNDVYMEIEKKLSVDFAQQRWISVDVDNTSYELGFGRFPSGDCLLWIREARNPNPERRPLRNSKANIRLGCARHLSALNAKLKEARVDLLDALEEAIEILVVEFDLTDEFPYEEE